MSDQAHTWRDRLRDTDRTGAAFVIVLTTVALSFTSLQKLATLCGFTGWLSWAWPICLDAVAYLATRIWLANGHARRFAKGVAISSIVLSLIANGLVHALTEYRMTPHWTIVVLVGAVPPLMLALVIHMLVADRPATPAVKATRRVEKTPPAKIVKPEPVTIESEPVGDDSADLSGEMRAAGWAPTEYRSAKAAMQGYLEKVDSNIIGADLEKIVGQFFKITPNTGAGRRAVRDFKAATAAATQGKG